MGFAGSSCSFSRFRILDPVTDEVICQIPEWLIKHAFEDIDDLPVPQGHGWVCFDDMFDSQWKTSPPRKGSYIVFSLRLDTRRIPPGVIKKHLELALREEKQTMELTGHKFISRERIKELKDMVVMRLRQRFLPVPGEFNVIWNLDGNEVWFASIQSRMIDLFVESFLTSFGLHLEQLTPYNLASRIVDEQTAEKLDSLEATRFVNL